VPKTDWPTGIGCWIRIEHATRIATPTETETETDYTSRIAIDYAIETSMAPSS